MKTILTTPYSLPIGYNDYTNLPFNTPYIPTGTYHLHILGKIEQSTTDTQQVFIKTTFNMPGGPTLSDSQLISHSRAGLSYDGSNTVQTRIPPLELGTFNGVEPLLSSFEWIGQVTVSSGGYLSLAIGGEIEVGKPVVVTEAVIDIW